MGAFMKGKIYGAVTVGERGQVVIPAEIRKSFKVNAGDKLIVFAKPGGMIGLVPAEEFNQFLEEASRMISKFRR